MDPKELNNLIIKEPHLIHTLEEIIPKLNNKTAYSVLDLSNGFWNIPITDDSIKLRQYNTPFGVYDFKRLSFGLSNAPEFSRK